MSDIDISHQDKKVEIIIGINRQLLIFASLLALLGIFYRSIDTQFIQFEKMNAIKFRINIIYSIAILYFIVSVIGLSMRKEWGRQIAIGANLFIFFTTFGNKIIILFIFPIIFDMKFIWVNIFFKTTDDKIQLFTSLIALIMMIVLSRKDFKNKYLRNYGS